MTFSFDPWALDGAVTSSALARRAQYNSMSGAEGITQKGDLKVSQLTVAGNGLLISGGDATILNRYLTAPRTINEVYTVSNTTTHQVPSSAMPSSQPAAKSYLVLVTVGDPEFSQVGHPWMTSDILDDEEAAVFEYVRVYIVECPAGTTSFKQLGLNYPAYAIARLDIPANHGGTVTDSMIKDLRKMARPRVSEELFIDNSGGGNALNVVSPAWEGWTGQNPTIEIPEWATVAKVQAWVESAVISKATNGNVRIQIVGGGATASTPFNRSAPTSGADRTGITLGGSINVASIAGTSKVFQVQGQVASSASAGGLASDGVTSTQIRVRFEEVPV